MLGNFKHRNLAILTYSKNVGWLLWGSTVLSTQFRSYHAFEVIIYFDKFYFNLCIV